MADNIAISLTNVSKVFKRYRRPADRLKEILLPGKSYVQEFWALQDISLEIPRGETWGIVGRNGAGKSTLLKIITGTLQPTSGTVQVNGRVSALLELGSGFNPEFTGRQNVFFNGRLLGLSQLEVEQRFEDIVAFADIGDFLDQPVKTYSSGMRARLAFAVASSVDPDVLIVDEVLGVGDIAFQHKCTKRMRDLMDAGTTTLFVSHNAGSIKTLCIWSVMLHRGEIKALGKPDAVLAKYMKLITDEQITETESVPQESPSEASREGEPLNKGIELIEEIPQMFRRGTGKARIQSIRLYDGNKNRIVNNGSCEFDKPVTLLVRLKAFEILESLILGFYICDRNGNELVGSNTLQENCSIGKLEPEEELEVKFEFSLPLKPGSYSVTIAGAERYGSTTLDWIDNAITFTVLPPDSGKRIHAMFSIPMKVTTTNIKTDCYIAHE